MDDYKTGSLFNFTYFQKNYMLIAIDLSKQQALIDDPNAIKKINFKRRRTGDGTMFFIIEKWKLLFWKCISIPKIYFGINVK